MYLSCPCSFANGAGTLEGAHAAALQLHVARLVTTAPAQHPCKEEYIANVCTQTRDLVLYGLFKNDKVGIC